MGANALQLHLFKRVFQVFKWIQRQKQGVKF